MPPKAKASEKAQSPPVASSEGPDAVFAWVNFGVVDDQALRPLIINLDVDVDILIEHLKALLSLEMAAYCESKRLLIEQTKQEPEGELDLYCSIRE